MERVRNALATNKENIINKNLYKNEIASSRKK